MSTTFLLLIFSACMSAPQESPLYYLPPSSISKFQIVEGTKVFSFGKAQEGERWTLETRSGIYIVDQLRIKQFLQDYGNPKVIPHVARRGLDLTQFGLNPPRQLILFKAALVDRQLFLIGDEVGDGKFYVSDGAREAVFLWDSNGKMSSELDVKHYRNRQVFNVSMADYLRLSHQFNGKKTRLDLKGEEWRQGKQVIAQSLLQRLFKMMGDLRTEDFLSAASLDLTQAFPANKTRSFELEFKRGGVASLKVGALSSNPQQRYVQTSLTPEVMVVSVDQLQQLESAWGKLSAEFTKTH